MEIGGTKFNNHRAATLVEVMRRRLIKDFGISIQGDTVALRFDYHPVEGPAVAQVTMIIVSIDDGLRDPDDNP